MGDFGACRPHYGFRLPSSELDADRVWYYRGRDRVCVAVKSVGHLSWRPILLCFEWPRGLSVFNPQCPKLILEVS
jgi:hypothetical protein